MLLFQHGETSTRVTSVNVGARGGRSLKHSTNSILYSAFEAWKRKWRWRKQGVWVYFHFWKGTVPEFVMVAIQFHVADSQ